MPLGVISAIFRGSLLDRALMLVTMVGQSMPIFWVGLLMILVFAVGLQWLPAGGAAWDQVFGPARRHALSLSAGPYY